ncbi:MAG: HAD-IC family P-type ATPase [bacterium]|nr:HAD-IC family P-type ATPase [bacterium]
MQENFKLILSILWRQVASLFFVLLLVSALVSFFMGERVDAIIILVVMFVNLLLGFFQEYKASKAGEKLLHLVQTKVYVLRTGQLVQVPASELVVGDIVHLVAGSVSPVDVQVVESQNAFIDDSMRTGESIPREAKMGENIFAGATVSSGKIIGYVIAVGNKSSAAKYRSKLESVKKWSSFGVFTEKVIKYVFIISIVTLLVSMFFLVFVMGKVTLASFFVFAIAMLVGVVPEMLPLIITIILTRESLLLAKEKVIVKRLSALESIGAVRFLLTDKTGTITENKLKVSAVNDVEDFWELSNSITEGDYERMPMDMAYDESLNSSIAHIKTNTKKIKSFVPFNHECGYEVFTLEGGEKVARGIISKVLSLCKDSKKSEVILKSALAYENKGMRVIAQAKAVAGEWTFSGFVAFHDPIKPSATESLKIAHDRGILVKVLTGDTKAVAMYVAEELHLIKSGDNIISLEDTKVSDLSDKQLMRAVVFAKCTPENKLELMNRYLKLGPVAFLGDGINDALALKRADIGIAVDNASDIAKESGDIILLEKDLSPILKSVSMGRKALRNILTYIMYTLSGNAGTFFSLLIASFFYPVLPMLPIQILLNNLLTDLPLMLIITDNPDEYALRHVPHFEPKKILKRVFIFGMISSTFDLIYFQLYQNASVAEFQTGWFVLSILAELVLILSIRSSRSIFKSPALSIPLLGAIVVTSILPFILIYTTSLSEIFKFAALPLSTITTLLCLTAVYVFANEVAKFFMRRKNLYNKPLSAARIFKTP